MTFKQQVESRIVRRDGDKGYDQEHNIIYQEPNGENGHWGWWSEPDADGNDIHFLDSEGQEEWSEYKNNKQTHFKSGGGVEWWAEYDDEGNQIYTKNVRGNESWMKYNEDGNEIHSITSNGYQIWREWDGNDLIYHAYSSGLNDFNPFSDLLDAVPRKIKVDKR